MQKDASHRTALIELHLGTVLLSAAALFPRVFAIPATQIVQLRCAIAALILLGIALFLRHRFTLHSRRDALWLMVCSALVGLHWVTYYIGIQTGGVALAVVCFYSYPVMTVLLEPLFGETRLRLSDLLAGLAVLTGVLIAANPAAGSAVWLAAALCVFSALCYALRNTLYRRYLREYSPYSLMGWQFLLVALALIPSVAGGVTLAPDRWWLMLVFGVFFTAAPHWLFVAGLQHVSAKTLSLINSMMPLYATFFAWVFLGEGAGLNTLIGGTLIVGAAMYESLKSR